MNHVPWQYRSLYGVASKVRQRLEKEAKKFGVNPVTLDGYSAIGAYELLISFLEQQFLAVFVRSHTHCFCRVGFMTVDVTPTQSRLPPVHHYDGVLIADLRRRPDMRDWIAIEAASTPADVLRLSCWEQWPISMRPRRILDV